MDLKAAKKILIFGGSFDPPQVAHVALPKHVMQIVHADRVMYVPAGQSPFKLETPPAPAHHRLAMLRLALRDAPWAMILSDEIDRPHDRDPSYTVDTLASLRRRLGDHVEMRLLIGSDQLPSFDRWKEPDRIIAMAEPLVIMRPPATSESLASLLPPGAELEAWENRLVETPMMDVSSTQVRAAAAAGRSLRGIVVDAVERYIQQHQLYR